MIDQEPVCKNKEMAWLHIDWNQIMHNNLHKIHTCNLFELKKLSKSNSLIRLCDKSSQCRCGICPKISRVVFCKQKQQQKIKQTKFVNSMREENVFQTRKKKKPTTEVWNTNMGVILNVCLPSIDYEPNISESTIFQPVEKIRHLCPLQHCAINPIL